MTDVTDSSEGAAADAAGPDTAGADTAANAGSPTAAGPTAAGADTGGPKEGGADKGGADGLEDRPNIVEGQLPAAETIEVYERVLSGSADRILVMLEDQSKHRLEMKRTATRAAAINKMLGQVLGVAFALVVFLTATQLITNHHEIPGTLLAVADLGLLVAVFLGRDRPGG